MSVAVRAVTEDDGPLSPWWIRARPDCDGARLCRADRDHHARLSQCAADPGAGGGCAGRHAYSAATTSATARRYSCKYGLMDNGTIWGHGAYLGPDYSAEALHRMGDGHRRRHCATAIRQPLAALTPMQQAAMRAETAVTLKTNRYDAANDTLHLTAPEAAAYRQQIDYWTDYFKDPVTQRRPQARPDHRSRPNCTSSPPSSPGRPGRRSPIARASDYSYTNNFPYDPECRQSAHPGCAVVERAESDGAAGRHRRGAAGVRQIRLSGLDHSRPSRAPATDSRASPAAASARW